MGQIVSDVTEILDYKNDKKDAKSERKKILAEMAADDAEKTNLVRKAVASQRAKYGAAGMSNSGVTEGAVLSRLKSETGKSYDDKRKTNIEKLKKINVKKPNLIKSLLSRFDELVG